MPPGADPPSSPDLRDELARAAVKRLAAEDEHVEIELEGAALPEQRAAGVGLEAVRLSQVDLSSSRLERLSLLDCELRGSDLTGAQGIDSLRGMAVAWTDVVDMAGVWAAALGIEVLED